VKADVRRDAVTPAPVASDALATIQDELSSSRSNSVAVMQIALMATHLDSDDLVFRAFKFHAWNSVSIQVLYFFGGRHVQIMFFFDGSMRHIRSQFNCVCSE
jgi:hypothetical protein